MALGKLTTTGLEDTMKSYLTDPPLGEVAGRRREEGGLRRDLRPLQQVCPETAGWK